MSERVVICDFCSCPLEDAAWDFPCDDIDYGGLRTGPGAKAPTEGAIGSWLACLDCAELVNHGQRLELAERSANRLAEQYPTYVVSFGTVALLRAVHAQQDRFWAARQGRGTPIGAEQLALVSHDPEIVMEDRRR